MARGEHDVNPVFQTNMTFPVLKNSNPPWTKWESNWGGASVHFLTDGRDVRPVKTACFCLWKHLQQRVGHASLRQLCSSDVAWLLQVGAGFHFICFHQVLVFFFLFYLSLPAKVFFFSIIYLVSELVKPELRYFGTHLKASVSSQCPFKG